MMLTTIPFSFISVPLYSSTITLVAMMMFLLFILPRAMTMFMLPFTVLLNLFPRFFLLLLASFFNQVIPHRIIQINPLSYILLLTLIRLFNRRIQPSLWSNIKSLYTRFPLIIQFNFTFLTFTLIAPSSFPFRLSIVS